MSEKTKADYRPTIIENRPTIEKGPPFFLNKAVAKGAFLLKVRPQFFSVVHAVMLSKKHQRNSTVQEEGLTNEGRQCLLLLH